MKKCSEMSTYDPYITVVFIHAQLIIQQSSMFVYSLEGDSVVIKDLQQALFNSWKFPSGVTGKKKVGVLISGSGQGQYRSILVYSICLSDQL